MAYIGSYLTIRQDNASVIGSNCKVYGSNCSVSGSNCKVWGHSNKVSGSNCKVYGNDNIISGSNCQAEGNNNRLKGTNCKASGNNNSVDNTSNNDIINGRGNFGSNNSVYVANGVAIGNISVTNYDDDDNSIGIVNQGVVNGNMVSNTKYYAKNLITPIKEKKDKKEKFVEGPTPTELNNDKETDEGACVICLSNRSICITDPCRHLCVCVKCARELCFGPTGDKLNKRGDVKCPNCRNEVKSILRVYE